MNNSRINGFISKLSQTLFGKRMIIAKSRKDLDRMRDAGELIAEVREAVRMMIAPGMTTLELNAAARKMMVDAGAKLQPVVLVAHVVEAHPGQAFGVGIACAHQSPAFRPLGAGMHLIAVT